MPFQVSLTEAQRAFERWQQAHWLAPGRVLRRGQTEMKALLLPFWLFEAAFQVEYTGVRPPAALPAAAVCVCAKRCRLAPCSACLSHFCHAKQPQHGVLLLLS